MFAKKYMACAVCSLAFLGVSLPTSAATPEMNKADNAQAMTSMKEIKLTNWDASSHAEKMAFLIGFATMIELEHEWQAKHPLPIDKSTVPSWVKGFAGVKLSDIVDAVDKYSAAHPAEGEKNVLLVLSEIYVQPKLTDAEVAASKKHYEKEVKPNLKPAM